MKKMVVIIAVSAILHVGSAAAAAGAGADTKQNNDLIQKGNVIVSVGKNASGNVIANTQVQHAMDQLNKAIASAEASATATANVQFQMPGVEGLPGLGGLFGGKGGEAKPATGGKAAPTKTSTTTKK